MASITRPLGAPPWRSVARAASTATASTAVPAAEVLA
jgi:hypothetical protein